MVVLVSHQSLNFSKLWRPCCHGEASFACLQFRDIQPEPEHWNKDPNICCRPCSTTVISTCNGSINLYLCYFLDIKSGVHSANDGHVTLLVMGGPEKLYLTGSMLGQHKQRDGSTITSKVSCFDFDIHICCW